MEYLYRRTKHLQIRPLSFKDFSAWKYANLAMYPSRNRWDHGGKSEKDLTKEQFKKLLIGQRKRRKLDTFYDLGVFNREGKLVGNVSLMEVVRGISQTAYLGYRIYNNYWRLGYGKEAVQAMIDIGFKDIKLHRIEAGIEPGNIRSIRLVKSIGMRREGHKKRAIFLRSQWVDLLMYTLTSEDIGLKFGILKLRSRSRF